jgi:hypothetical protein
VTDQSSDIPIKRRHVATGKPRGGSRGSVNLRHGLRSQARVARRKTVMELVRQCREAVEMARRGD